MAEKNESMDILAAPSTDVANGKNASTEELNSGMQKLSVDGNANHLDAKQAKEEIFNMIHESTPSDCREIPQWICDRLECTPVTVAHLEVPDDADFYHSFCSYVWKKFGDVTESDKKTTEKVTSVMVSEGRRDQGPGIILPGNQVLRRFWRPAPLPYPKYLFGVGCATLTMEGGEVLYSIRRETCTPVHTPCGKAHQPRSLSIYTKKPIYIGEIKEGDVSGRIQGFTTGRRK